MDRNRDGRRGSMAAVNGLSRRRPRTGSLRDSPEEDGGAVEMQESTRLRDRGSKKDRDRDRSSRSKRRRGDHMMHGSNREDGEDSTDESMDEEEEEDDDDSGAAVRLPLPPPPPPPNPSPHSSALPANHNHRKSLPTKVVRPPPVWKVADEMIGVSVPRKARTASAKRSHECWLSGSGGGGSGGGEQMHRQTSTSPSRPSQAAAAPAPISPSSSNASVRKKTKQICGTKHRPPKISKSQSSSIQEIEFEVAEVLYGLTRQFQAPQKQEAQMPDSKDANGCGTETKSRASSPNSISPPPAISQSPALLPQNFSPSSVVAPKRKRPRPVKLEDENPTSPSNHSVSVHASSTSKAADVDQPKMDASSPKSEKAAFTPAENGGASLELCSHQVEETPADAHEESKEPETTPVSDVNPPVPELGSHDRVETKDESLAGANESAAVEFDANDAAATAVKIDSAAECPREKFQIDLMAPPPGKSSPERDSDIVMDDKSSVPDVEMDPKVEPLKGEDRIVKPETREGWREEKGDKGSQERLDSEKPIKKEASLDLQLEVEKHDKDGISVNKHPGLRQQSKVTRAEFKPDKAAQAGSLPLPVPVAGWPGGLPFGYMGQVPPLQPVVPMDSSSVASKALQAQHYLSQQLPPKRCATHCYIAQNIYYHQQLARINPFWPAAAGSTPSLYGAKPYNLNVMPTADSAVLSNPLQAGFPGRGLGVLQDKVAPVVGSFPNHSSKEKVSPANFIDTAQRKQIVLQQPLQAGATSNMLPAPAFIFPLSQPQAPVAASATSRTAHVKSTNINVASSSSGSGAAIVSSGSASASAPAVSFNYGNLPQAEAQYLLLQNHGYPFPIPAHVGAPPFRGANHTQAMPFFSGSLYAPQILHSSQLQQQQQHHQQHQHQPLHPPPSQPAPQNASTSTGSSSSQKHPQHSQKTPGGNAGVTDGLAHGPPTSKQRQHLPPPHQQARQLDCETGGEDSPSTADSSRISQSQKGIYNHNFVMPLNPPPSQPFAMSFASFNGATAPGHHGLDFSATAQNHAIFQSLPEMARHGYQLTAPAAAAQAAQHKKAQQHPEGGKFLGESMNVTLSGEEERKAMLAGKAPSGISQHSLSFARPDSDPSGSAIVGNNVFDSSGRTLNLIPASGNGGQVHGRPTSTTPAAAVASSASGGALNAQQQQQHLIQLQKQHQQHQQQQQQQQQLQMQQQLTSRAKPAGASSNPGVYSDRLPAGAAMPKFPNPLTGFPQPLIQASNPSQSPQWKNSARNSTSIPSPAPNPTPPAKSHLPQQQGRTPQPTHSNVGLHSQISFGMNSMKPSPSGQQQQVTGANSIPTSVSMSAAASSVGSPPSSMSKGAGGSPRASSGVKTGPPNTTLPLQQPTLPKNSAAGTSRKSSPVSNRNVPSILGQPHVSSPSSISKSQHHHQQLQLPLQQQQQNQQQQHQLQKHQQFPAAQIFFSNSYLPAQSPHSAAAATPGYHQRRSSEQQQQQHYHHHQQPNSPSVSSGMLSLCAPALTLAGNQAATSDPAKAAAAAAAAPAANSIKGLSSPNLLQAQFAAAAAHPASGSAHTLMSAAGFPYFHAMSSVSVKPAEQKPAAGNDTLHACWQPEKR